MKNLKFILPMLAFVLAIGMSFAFVGTVDPQFDYVDTGDPNNPLAIPETECITGTQFSCEVQLVEGGIEYQVYDDKDLNIEKTGATKDTVIKYWQ